MEMLDAIRNSIGKGCGKCPAEKLAQLSGVSRATVFRFSAGADVSTHTLRKLDIALRAWRDEASTPSAPISTDVTTPHASRARAQ